MKKIIPKAFVSTFLLVVCAYIGIYAHTHRDVIYEPLNTIK